MKEKNIGDRLRFTSTIPKNSRTRRLKSTWAVSAQAQSEPGLKESQKDGERMAKELEEVEVQPNWGCLPKPRIELGIFACSVVSLGGYTSATRSGGKRESTLSALNATA